MLATANAGKAREMRVILGEGGLIVLDRPADAPDVEETGATLEENAIAKARAIGDHTGLAALSDDSGLEVDALGGRPGVRSARYAGEHATYDENVSMLLAELAGRGGGAFPGGVAEPAGTARRAATAGPDGVGEVAGSLSTARFRTVACLYEPGGSVILADGTIEGWIVGERRGGGGFGYDPVFVPAGGGGRTFAEMAPKEKNLLSHRAAALRSLLQALGDESKL